MTRPRTKAEYAAAADWAERDAPDATAGVTHSAPDAAQHGRALIAAYLPDDPADDSPPEAFARAELARIRRGPGRPSLTGPGVQSKPRQVRLPSALDDALARYVTQAHTTRSEVMRVALEEYLEAHKPA